MQRKCNAASGSRAPSARHRPALGSRRAPWCRCCSAALPQTQPRTRRHPQTRRWTGARSRTSRRARRRRQSPPELRPARQTQWGGSEGRTEVGVDQPSVAEGGAASRRAGCWHGVRELRAGAEQHTAVRVRQVGAGKVCAVQPPACQYLAGQSRPGKGAVAQVKHSLRQRARAHLGAEGSPRGSEGLQAGDVAAAGGGGRRWQRKCGRRRESKNESSRSGSGRWRSRRARWRWLLPLPGRCTRAGYALRSHPMAERGTGGCVRGP